MNKAQKFLLDNNLADQVISKPNKTFTYVSDVMETYKEDLAITVDELDDEHELVCAGKLMVDAHNKFDSIKPAVDFVAKEHPKIDYQLLIVLWIGINCKFNEQYENN